MTTPQIITGWGATDREWAEAERHRSKLVGYHDLSTVIVMPTRGMIPARVVDAFMSLLRPPNAKTTQIFAAGMEVAEAYNWAVGMILDHPDLSEWRYLLTVEEDNLLPPLALIDLQREMIRGGWDVLGGLYHTKGAGGVPQIWGDPSGPYNFRPIPPKADKVVRCNGTGMGCTLWRIDVFRRHPGPWFETVADERGIFTQDLFAFHRWHQAGVKLKIGVDCRIKVGHLDADGRVW